VFLLSPFFGADGASLQYVSGNRVLLGVDVGGVSTPDEGQAAGRAESVSHLLGA
jgi:hypothetical protein